MTINELNVWITSHSHNVKESQKINLINAYYQGYFTAAFQNTKSKPHQELKRILKKLDDHDTMTDEMMFENIKSIHKQFEGGE